MKNKIIIYSSNNCNYCVKAKVLLAEKGLAFEEINIQVNPEYRDEMLSKSQGKRTVPQIFINDTHIGGYNELLRITVQGRLETYLSDEQT